jgi:glutamine amidotransferase
MEDTVSPRVVVLDYGSGNLRSAQRALARVGAEVEVTGDLRAAAAADGLVVPGVGAYAACMAGIEAIGAGSVIADLVHDGRPVLGICVGMQILFERSEEGDIECLGLLRGRIAKMPATKAARMPHMGWNRIWPSHSSSLIEAGDAGAYAYFVHGFAAQLTSDCIAIAEHGAPFSAAVQRGNVAGVQFHPERSAAFGARVLRRFVEREAA